MTKNIEEIFDKLLSDMGVSYYAHFIKSEGTNFKFEVILSRTCPDESKQGSLKCKGYLVSYKIKPQERANVPGVGVFMY